MQGFEKGGWVGPDKRSNLIAGRVSSQRIALDGFRIMYIGWAPYELLERSNKALAYLKEKNPSWKDVSGYPSPCA